jgi:ribonuclease E
LAAQPTPQPVKPPVATIAPAERRAYEKTVTDRETQEHAQRVQMAKDEAARRQAEAARQALAKKQAEEAYQKSVAQREAAAHAQAAAAAPAMPATPAKPPVAVAPNPPASAPAAPAVNPPVVAVIPAAPAIAPAPAKPPVAAQPAPQPVAAPAVATISPAQRRAYETTVRDREAQEHAQRVQVAKDAEAQKKLNSPGARKKSPSAKISQRPARSESTASASKRARRRKRPGMPPPSTLEYR